MLTDICAFDRITSNTFWSLMRRISLTAGGEAELEGRGCSRSSPTAMTLTWGYSSATVLKGSAAKAHDCDISFWGISAYDVSHLLTKHASVLTQPHGSHCLTVIFSIATICSLLALKSKVCYRWPVLACNSASQILISVVQHLPVTQCHVPQLVLADLSAVPGVIWM